jgi:hypothetical protein
VLSAVSFRRRTDAVIGRLERAGEEKASALPVPPIIQSYLRRAVADRPASKVVCLRQSAEMRGGPGDSWRPLTAKQLIGVHEPGFVWVARMQVGSLLSVRILDCYESGNGLLEARLFGSLRLARAAGPETSKGELMRYLAELPWAPHAMLHNPFLVWREIDPSTIEVSAESTGGPVRVRLTFENGDVVRADAEDRPRLVGGRTIPTRWAGQCFDYREIDGCRVPTRAVASWFLESGPFDYFRCSLTAWRLM